MKKILFFSLVFSVIITAGTGCPVSAANNAEKSRDLLPNVEEQITPQHVDTIPIDVQCILKDVEQIIELIAHFLVNLEDSISLSPYQNIL